MKKRALSLLIATLCMCALTACGKEKETTETTQSAETVQSTESTTETETTDMVLLSDYNASDIVTLNEYKGMEVTLTGPKITDEDVDGYINSILSGYGGTEGLAVTDRAIVEGDTVNINYVGKLDGVAFAGGTDDSEAGTHLTIGSNTFIPGFEEGLIGVTPGETVDLTLTFPDPYQNNPDLAGKETVFTVTVNGIAPTVADLTDENVSLLDETATTVAQYKTDTKTMLEDEARLEFETYYNAYLEEAVIVKIMDECVYKDIPTELVERYNNNIIINYTNEAAQYGLDLESYATLVYGITADEFKAEMRVMAEQAAKQAIAFQAIADKENLHLTEEQFAEELQLYVESCGYTSADELPAGVAEEYREYLTFKIVSDYLMDNAVVTIE